jgi:hypothetical protein
LLALFKKHQHVPYVLAANKADQKGLSGEEIRLALKLPEKQPVVPCIATDKKSAQAVVERLIAMISGLMTADGRPPTAGNIPQSLFSAVSGQCSAVRWNVKREEIVQKIKRAATRASGQTCAGLTSASLIWPGSI